MTTTNSRLPSQERILRSNMDIIGNLSALGFNSPSNNRDISWIS